MKLSVIALDYDGTMAHGDRPDPAVLDAIAFARSRGITVLIVTGRILSELRRVAGPLGFVDGVVAENGAVIHLPGTGYTTMLAPPVSREFVARLEGKGVRFQVGQCLVDADASSAPRMLEAIREIELPIVLIFNRSQVMALAQGVSKATGLAAALNMLRVSPRNALAIGDAENDHELLRLAEVGAAVEWGSTSLQAASDVVVRGRGPAAVGEYIRTVAQRSRLPVPERGRRRLVIGHLEDGSDFSLAVRGRNVLITGETKSGKSWLAGLLCERLILHGYSICVIDPEGDYRTLEALPGVTVLGGDDPPPTPRDLGRALRYPDRSVIVDLAALGHEAKYAYIRDMLPALNVMRRRRGLPHRIILDEAHYFLHDALATELLDLDFNGYTVVTYWPSQLPPQLIAATEVILVTRESNPGEVEMLRAHCQGRKHIDASIWTVLRDLPINEAVALPGTEEAGTELRTFVVGERLTPHVRHRQKYVDVPVNDSHAFVFEAAGPGGGALAHTLREFVGLIEARDAPAADGYLRRGDFSRWIADVFGDHALSRDVHEYEERYAGGGAPDALERIAEAIRSRYDLSDES
jgi:hydroxymethylpyrimidine pyrophosphatase-like HAD family hydrolase